ncbi:MAG: acyltransferase [Alphaproteobacteria bacterium]|nr:acyltransferase [Alphaproteobacteria bacterium]
MFDRLPSLDAVRGLAAASVAIPHFFLFRDGHSPILEFVSIMAVEVFFVLSGVVLAPQLMRCVRSRAWHDVGTFYARRWMRTLPPYFFVLLAMGIVTGHLVTWDFAAYAVFARNLVSMDDAGDFFMVAWSLAVEEWFYLIFPVFLLLTVRWVPPQTAGYAFLAIFLVVKLAAMVLWPETFAAGRRIVVLRVDAICFGFLLSFVLRSVDWRLAAVGIAVAGATSALAFKSGSTLGFVYAASIASACLIVLFVAADSWLSRPLLARLSEFSARTSYMVYLAHTLAIILLVRASLSNAVALPIYLTAVYAFCWLFYRAIEAPILRARPAYRAELRASPA